MDSGQWRERLLSRVDYTGRQNGDDSFSENVMNEFPSTPNLLQTISYDCVISVIILKC